MTPQKDISIDIKRLSADDEYFTNVFKRVEKIVSVIFYVLSFTESQRSDEHHVRVIKDTALAIHEESLATLRLSHSGSTAALDEFRHSLFELESALRVATSAGVVPPKVTELLFEQLDLVQRFLKNHYQLSIAPQINEQVSSLLGSKSSPGRSQTDEGSRNKGASSPRKKQVRIPAGDISTDAYLVYSQLTDRAQRIQTVLEAKPQATIKDIAEIITDVSEKTIQRELNSLIEKGQVMREGERRWSRYSVVK